MSEGENQTPKVPAALQDAWGSFMQAALEQARLAATMGEVPVGAVVVDGSGQILARAHNLTRTMCDPSAHAEVLALRAACKRRGTSLLPDCTVVSTLEPCVMCAGAMLHARVARAVFGAWEEKTGGAGSLYDLLRDRRYPHNCEVIVGIYKNECARVLKRFFLNHRNKAPERDCREPYGK